MVVGGRAEKRSRAARWRRPSGAGAGASQHRGRSADLKRCAACWGDLAEARQPAGAEGGPARLTIAPSRRAAHPRRPHRPPRPERAPASRGCSRAARRRRQLRRANRGGGGARGGRREAEAVEGTRLNAPDARAAPRGRPNAPAHRRASCASGRPHVQKTAREDKGSEGGTLGRRSGTSALPPQIPYLPVRSAAIHHRPRAQRAYRGTAEAFGPLRAGTWRGKSEGALKRTGQPTTNMSAVSKCK